MDFIQTANKQVDKFGSGKHGFSAGNPSGGIPATYLSPEWCDNVQQEIVNVIEGSGIAIAPGSKTQLYQAIQALIATASGNDYKASVRAATVGSNITLAGGAPNTIDGVTLVANDRILVKDQTTGSQNGLYYVSTLGTGANGTWTRTTDADAAGELTSGAIVAVEEGTTNADALWMLTTDGPITIGTTSLTFSLKTGLSKQIQPVATPTLAGNAMTFPAASYTLDFRNATSGVGSVTTVSGTAAALTLPAGASLGLPSGVQGSIVEVIMNNGGVLEKAAINLAGGNDLTEQGVISTTAVSAGATSPNVFYSNTARTNLPYRVVARYDSTQATAGQWATAMSVIQGFGGGVYKSLSFGSVVRVNTANGNGSTNTGVRRFSTVAQNQGSDITYADSATLGASFTINTPGTYGIEYTDAITAAGDLAISLNGTNLTGSVPSNLSEVLSEATCYTTSTRSTASWQGPLKAGDVVRAQCTGTQSTTRQFFSISRIG